MLNTPKNSTCTPWRVLVIVSVALGAVVTAPALADFSITVFSPTVGIPITPQAPDDLLSMSSVAFGPPFLGEDAGGPGPVVTLPGPGLGWGGFEVDAHSWDVWSFTLPFGAPMALYFSVDGLAVGLPGSAVFREVALDNAPGDIFEATTYPFFVFPPPPAPMPLPFGAPGRPPFGPGSNAWAPMVLMCPPAGPPAENGGDHRNLSLIPTPPGPAAVSDDVDAIDCYLPAGFAYTSITGATGLPLPAGFSGADIFVAPPGGIPYAPAPFMGLDLVGPPGSDDIDALLVVDLDGFLGAAAPGVDFALFSLRAGSATLAFTGASPGDVFITNFTGSFDIFAYAGELGLAPGDELDALSLGFPQPPLRKCADQDGDGDVDLGDFSVFALCFGGAAVPPAATCPPGTDVDFDMDGDVDLGDFSTFALCFGGSGSPVPAACPLGC